MLRSTSRLIHSQQDFHLKNPLKPEPICIREREPTERPAVVVLMNCLLISFERLAKKYFLGENLQEMQNKMKRPAHPNKPLT